MTISISIDRKFHENFFQFYPEVQIEVPDHRFDSEKVKTTIKKVVNDMLEIDPYRVNGRAIVKVEEDGMSYYATFTEKFEITINFSELKGIATFKVSDRGLSRLI